MMDSAMTTAPLPENESQRLEALKSYDILDTENERDFDDLSALASQICDTPIALVSLIDLNRQWFKSKVGLDACETHRNLAFCAHAIHHTIPFIVEDTLADERFADNDLVTGAPHIRFYAGIPLVTPDGYALGTLCVIDTHPRKLNAEQLTALEALARQVVTQMELRRQAKQLKLANSVRERLISVLSHDLKNCFQVITGYAHRLGKHSDIMRLDRPRHIAKIIEDSSQRAHDQLQGLVRWSQEQLTSPSLLTTPVDVQSACEQAIDLCRAQATTKEITLSLTCIPCAVMANEFLLVSTLQNLLTNSIKFSHAGEKVVIAVTVKQGEVELCVADSGVGMTQAEAETLFNGKTSVSQAGTQNELGSGVGTKLVSDFISSYNGCLTVTSAPNKGTQVTLSLPKADNV